MANKYLKFSIEDMDFIEESDSSQFATARIHAFSSSTNRHDLTCSEDTLIKTAPTLYNKPILYSLDENLDDFYSHTAPEKSLICGFVVPDSAEFVRLPDSRLGLFVSAKIWKRYAPKVMELFARDKAKKKVSVEMEVFELSPREDELSEMILFAYTGICILGDYITEASPGANMEVLSFSDENILYKEILKKEFPKKVGWLNATKQRLDNSISIGFPYTSIGEINPALKGIKPPITLGQANEIARQAEAIGSNKEKNGWAIAISSFKKTHEIKDGKWVKKPSQSMSEKEDKSMEEEKKLELAVDSGKEEKKETIEEEKRESPVEQTEEKGVERKFEFPKNIDTEKMAAFFAEDEEEEIKIAREEMAKKEAADPGIMTAGMFAKMCKMAEKILKMAEAEKVYMSENEELKTFKASIEKAQKAFAVEKILNELSEKVSIPEEAKAEMIQESEKYSFSDLKIWETYCKAKSFDFAIKEPAKSDVTRVAMPFGNTTQKKNDDLWS